MVRRLSRATRPRPLFRMGLCRVSEGALPGDRPARADVLHSLFLHDQPARAAHGGGYGDPRDRRRRCVSRPDVTEAGQLRRDDGPLLALRRYRLDFPLSLPLPDQALSEPMTHAQPPSSDEPSRTSEAILHEQHPYRTYFMVFGALLVLLLVTVLATYLPTKEPWSFLIALFIAVIKAVLVIRFLIHGKAASRGTRLVS